MFNIVKSRYTVFPFTIPSARLSTRLDSKLAINLTLLINFILCVIFYYSLVLSESVLKKLCSFLCFLPNFYFQPNDSPSKTMKNVFYLFWKAYFIPFSEIFVFSSSPLFLPVSHWGRGCLKINLKVYDVIKCLNKNLITHFVWYLGKEKRYDIGTLSIDRVLNKEDFFGKIMQKMCIKS